MDAMQRKVQPSTSNHSNEKIWSRSHKCGVSTNSTIDQIDRDMSLHGCHVVGVQESCIKGNVTPRDQQDFVAFTSGANGKGQLEVEAWVNRSVLKKA